MIQGSGRVAPSPPWEGSLGGGFPTQIDDFSKESLLRSLPREIVLWRSPGGRIPHSKQHFPPGICSLLDENIVKTIAICMFCVTLFELAPSQKHHKMNKENSLITKISAFLKEFLTN